MCDVLEVVVGCLRECGFVVEQSVGGVVVIRLRATGTSWINCYMALEGGFLRVYGESVVDGERCVWFDLCDPCSLDGVVEFFRDSVSPVPFLQDGGCDV